MDAVNVFAMIVLVRSVALGHSTWTENSHIRQHPPTAHNCLDEGKSEESADFGTNVYCIIIPVLSIIVQ